MKVFSKGDRVRIPETFWVPSYRGQIGTVYSTSYTPDGAATCYVRLSDGRGAWELMSVLEAAPLPEAK